MLLRPTDVPLTYLAKEDKGPSQFFYGCLVQNRLQRSKASSWAGIDFQAADGGNFGEEVVVLSDAQQFLDDVRHLIATCPGDSSVDSSGSASIMRTYTYALANGPTVGDEDFWFTSKYVQTSNVDAANFNGRPHLSLMFRHRSAVVFLTAPDMSTQSQQNFLVQKARLIISRG